MIYLFLTRQLFSARTWKRLHLFSGLVIVILDRRALAHPGDAAQSALFRFHAAQRARRISRISLVLLHQRAAAALPESALSARLQHRSAPLLLAVPSGLAVSLERLFPRGREAFLQAGRSRRANAFARALLDRLRAGLLYVFHDAGILFDALLSGARAAVRFGHGDGRQFGSAGELASYARLPDARPSPPLFSGSWCAMFPRPEIFPPRSRNIAALTRCRSAIWRI